LGDTALAITCVRCGQSAEPPEARRVGFARAFKEHVLGQVCGNCWKEWEGMEVKVINEYRLNFLDPQHREMLQKACADFLQIPEQPAKQ
jgi:Fe-S cluster biosynthesis and repair protein YggX